MSIHPLLPDKPRVRPRQKLNHPPFNLHPPLAPAAQCNTPSQAHSAKSAHPRCVGYLGKSLELSYCKKMTRLPSVYLHEKNTAETSANYSLHTSYQVYQPRFSRPRPRPPHPSPEKEPPARSLRSLQLRPPPTPNPPLPSNPPLLHHPPVRTPFKSGLSPIPPSDRQTTLPSSPSSPARVPFPSVVLPHARSAYLRAQYTKSTLLYATLLQSCWQQQPMQRAHGVPPRSPRVSNAKRKTHRAHAHAHGAETFILTMPKRACDCCDCVNAYLVRGYLPKRSTYRYGTYLTERSRVPAFAVGVWRHHSTPQHPTSPTSPTHVTPITQHPKSCKALHIHHYSNPPIPSHPIPRHRETSRDVHFPHDRQVSTYPHAHVQSKEKKAMQIAT
ncbi:hypothetical protein PMIN01_06499 [Paraphaeosphaeria minitans]|uniref:Uncharacterized protein n=1 Tax=Paraphaeosphaeria minitans TaxID=565426 RepID=A0A9P6GJ31_9PLEO|nr:hypothetical protein PMIN01_06499 [Paraphaeosphaeria minitans]